MARSSFYSDSSSDEEYYKYTRTFTPARSSYAWGKAKKPHNNRYYKLLSKRKALPIWQYKDHIIKSIRNTQVILFDGETGSGKSTQIPQWCLELDSVTRVVCVQPRRIAAISLAQRVAQEMDVKLGEEVGYAVRFDHQANSQTLLKYVTDGILLRHAMVDKRLSCYDVIILDEIHERRLISDILLGVVKEVLFSRLDIKVIIMSATLNLKLFCEFFDDCPHVHIPGKLYPIEVVYSPKVLSRAVFSKFDKKRFLPYVFEAINVILEICIMEKKEGDILVFVTGKDEIDYICNSVSLVREDYFDSMANIEVIPLYADLPYSSQKLIFAPSPKSSLGRIGRKCIVATNIAETSITIEGVVFVVDSGKVKLSNLVGDHLKSILPEDISQSSGEQRAGRAGRTQPGKCYRLYPQSKFLKLAKYTLPEVLRCDLTSAILQLKTMGVDLTRFELIDTPSLDAIQLAVSNLRQLGAFDSLGNLTAIGLQISRFPLEADIARMLVASNEFKCQEDVLTLAAVLGGDRPGGVFLIEKEEKEKADFAKASLSHPSGDHLTYINVFNEFRSSYEPSDWCRDNFVNFSLMADVVSIRQQLTEVMYELYMMRPARRKFPISEAEYTESILRAVLTGFPCNTAVNDDFRRSKGKQRYITRIDRLKVTLHPSSTLDARSSSYPILCYNSCIQTSAKSYFICVVSVIDPEWLSTERRTPVEYTMPDIGRLYVSPYERFAKKGYYS